MRFSISSALMGILLAPVASEISITEYSKLLNDPLFVGLLNNANGADAFAQVLADKQTIGSISELIAEATDAGDVAEFLIDGESGDTDFPHGNLKPICTVGEFDPVTGTMIVGPPDGIGAYLKDDNTVRVVVQSESYLPGITSRPSQMGESYPYYINGGTSSFTGSHVQFVDYDREKLAIFMDGSFPASEMVKGSGELIEKSYNLKGELVGPRNREGATAYGAHYSNCDPDGNYVIKAEPIKADWLMQSLCSAHMTERHTFGPGIGVDRDLFITNEEWIVLADDTTSFVGISAHAIDVHTKTDYAIGAMTVTGFEKIVEINTGHPDFVAFALCGYNGAYYPLDKIVENRQSTYGLRADGKNYTRPTNIVPGRVYIGKKGYMEDGSKADGFDFLAKNGLRYGKVYGFAVDMTESGPTKGLWRDDFHRDATLAKNGATVKGLFAPLDWQWDGVVKDFIHDGAWEFQDAPPNTPEGYQWWNSKGLDEAGCKMEHGSPDLREGVSGFIQGSTCGYFGGYHVDGMFDALADLTGNELPGAIDASYVVYQGELDIRSQIHLGGKGQYADGKNATSNYSGSSIKKVDTFEDIDGFEVVIGEGGKQYAIIQEDSGNRYGERMFITELKTDGEPLQYYFIGLSGGDLNSRMAAGVGVPAGVNRPELYGRSGHEFSGITDLSGFLRKNPLSGKFAMNGESPGFKRVLEESKVHINDKNIIVVVQAHNLFAGQFDYFNTDRGGQWMMYKPDVPDFD